MLILAILIAFATIYGRYHYAIDTVAGLILALVGWGVSTRFRRGGGQARNLRPNEPPR
jgi:membrane-associated phospholipid phosphatase